MREREKRDDWTERVFRKAAKAEAKTMNASLSLVPNPLNKPTEKKKGGAKQQQHLSTSSHPLSLNLTTSLLHFPPNLLHPFPSILISLTPNLTSNHLTRSRTFRIKRFFLFLSFPLCTSSSMEEVYVDLGGWESW